MAIDKIICVGKNYLDHAKELGETVPEKPVLFLKPASVLKQVEHWGEQVQLEFPTEDSAVQPECEIVLRVAHEGYKMSKKEAESALAAVSLGLDMTLRTRQSELKKQGHPWTTAKVFKDAAVVGPWILYDQFKNYLDTEFQLFINGELRQGAKGSEMRLKPADLLVYISQFFPLKSGDLIYTGTPAGVSSIVKGASAELSWGDYGYQLNWV